jgi:hypothetical protein
MSACDKSFVEVPNDGMSMNHLSPADEGPSTLISDEYIRTPDFVYEVFPDCADTCSVKIELEDNTPRLHYYVGDLNTERCVNVPPKSTFNGELLFDMMDALMAGDVVKTCDVITKIYEHPPELVSSAPYVSEVQESESNMERSFFSTFSWSDHLARIGADSLVLYRPSRGTVKRFNDANPAECPLILLHEDSPDDYKRSIRSMVQDMNYHRRKHTGTGVIEIKVIDDTYLFSDNVCYYMSFACGDMPLASIKHYVGFQPNLVSLGTRGDLHEISVSETHRVASYYRKDEKRQIYYSMIPRDNHFVYPVDFLFRHYREKKCFHTNGAHLHDLVSSSLIPAFDVKLKIDKRSIYSYDCYYLSGDYYHDKHHVYDENGGIVATSGSLAWSCRTIPPLFKKDLAGDGTLRQRSSYMISPYSACIVYLGHKIGVTSNPFKAARSFGLPIPTTGAECDRVLHANSTVDRPLYFYGPDSTTLYACRSLNLCDAYLIGRKTGLYYNHSVNYDKVDAIVLPITIGSIVGMTHYCGSTYQTISSTKCVYVHDDADPIFGPPNG